MKTAAYGEPPEENRKEQIIMEFLPFIRYSARRLGWRLPPGMSEEDLISSGVVGLLDALQRFQPGTVKLKTYAEHRIRGAMLDELRAADTLPRNVRDRVNAMKNAHTRLEHQLGRLPDDFEVAAAIGVSLDEYHKTLRESGSALLLRFEDFTGRGGEEGTDGLLQAIPDREGRDPLSLLERSDMKDLLADVIRELPEKERLVLSLYYWDELTMKEIGKVLGLTEGRVSQLHGQALLRCKSRFSMRHAEV
jgi:RNA polymerase sigma factor for flagellar operon FliA